MTSSPDDVLEPNLDALHLSSNDEQATILLDLPCDIMDAILSYLSDISKDEIGQGGLNNFRRVSTKSQQAVESCTTVLTHLVYKNGPETFPMALKRCKRVEAIRCYSHNLRTLDGCPVGLKDLNVYGGRLESLEPLRHCTRLERLEVGIAQRISDLSPLASCTLIRRLHVNFSLVEDISVLASMPLLEELLLPKFLSQGLEHSIEDVSPLADCTKLSFLMLTRNANLMDLTPLSNCKELEWMDIIGISPLASVLPLAACTKLEFLNCNKKAVGISELKAKLPLLKF